MSRQASAPPTRDKGAPIAPPPPPAWRHFLWPVALLIFVVLLFVLPATQSHKQVTLNYSQFLERRDGAQGEDRHHLADRRPPRARSSNGGNYTTVDPAPGGPDLPRPAAEGRASRSPPRPAAPRSAPQVLSWVILLLPFLVLGFLWWRLSKGAAGRLQGALGVGKSKAKVFDEERPKHDLRRRGRLRGRQARDPRGRRLPPAPRALRPGGRHGPAGRADGGPAGHRQDAARPGRGRRGRGAVLLGHRLELRRDVRRASGRPGSATCSRRPASGRRPSSSSTRSTPSASAAVGLGRGGLQRRAGADPQPAAGRDGRLRPGHRASSCWPPPTGPRCSTRRCCAPAASTARSPSPSRRCPSASAILQVHCRGKQLDPSVDLEVVARGTPGFSGADLANLVNEAAIVAVRAGPRRPHAPPTSPRPATASSSGRREGSNVLLPEEKHAVAVHEAGHALVAAYSDKADPVAKVTILPGRPDPRRHRAAPARRAPPLRRGLPHDIARGLPRRPGQRARRARPGLDRRGQRPGQGDRARHQDGARVRALVRRSDRSATPRAARSSSAAAATEFSSRPFAEQTQAAIDAEVARLLREAEQRAVATAAGQHRDVLDRLVELLVAEETVDGSAVYALAGRDEPADRPGRTVAPGRGAPVAPPPSAVGAE